MTGGQHIGYMKRYTQYRIPSERVSDEYRASLGVGFTKNGCCDCQDDTGSQAQMTEWPDDMPLAMVYSPQQTFTDIYEDAEGLSRGSLFSDLYFPFEAACRGTMR